MRWKQNWKLASWVFEARVQLQIRVSKTRVLVLSWSNLSTWNLSFSNLSSIELSADEDEEEPKNQIGSQNRRKNLEEQNRKTKIWRSRGRNWRSRSEKADDLKNRWSDLEWRSAKANEKKQGKKNKTNSLIWKKMVELEP